MGQPSKPDKPNETDQSSETNKPKQPASSPLTIGTDLRVQDYRPKSQLVVPATNLRHAKFPVVDVHTHFYNRTRHNRQGLEDFVEVMNQQNIAACVSLDGRLGDRLVAHKRYLWKEHADRFLIFTNVNWIGNGRRDDPSTWACHQPGFGKRTATAIRAAAAEGVCGLKLYKSFGLGLRNPDGTLVKIDDPRWSPIFDACGDVGIPVIIHTADPAAFFQPIDETNERYEELSRHPSWSFYTPPNAPVEKQFPSRLELLEARNRLLERHKNTTFIGAHVANYPEDLETVSRWLRRYPNLVVEFASRINELGRQPYSARKFLIQFQDRVLFGTDGPWPEQRLRYYWRFLETRDEDFPYSEKIPPPQGLWNIQGVGLPDQVLKKIYHQNAARIIPGVRERLDKYQNLSKSSFESKTPEK
ncbi:MAG: amidohydrolase family protein [Planctomycetota bacterium]